MKCPNCGSCKAFYAFNTDNEDVTVNRAGFDENGDIQQLDQLSSCVCSKCGYEATAEDFCAEDPEFIPDCFPDQEEDYDEDEDEPCAQRRAEPDSPAAWYEGQFV